MTLPDLYLTFTSTNYLARAYMRVIPLFGLLKDEFSLISGQFVFARNQFFAGHYFCDSVLLDGASAWVDPQPKGSRKKVTVHRCMAKKVTKRHKSLTKVDLPFRTDVCSLRQATVAQTFELSCPKLRPKKWPGL